MIAVKPRVVTAERQAPHATFCKALAPFIKALDARALDQSWRFECAKPAYCIPLDRSGMTSALAAAQRDVELPHGSWRR